MLGFFLILILWYTWVVLMLFFKLLWRRKAHIMLKFFVQLLMWCKTWKGQTRIFCCFTLLQVESAFLLLHVNA
jgi:hypothetical protein